MKLTQIELENWSLDAVDNVMAVWNHADESVENYIIMKKCETGWVTKGVVNNGTYNELIGPSWKHICESKEAAANKVSKVAERFSEAVTSLDDDTWTNWILEKTDEGYFFRRASHLVWSYCLMGYDWVDTRTYDYDKSTWCDSDVTSFDDDMVMREDRQEAYIGAKRMAESINEHLEI